MEEKKDSEKIRTSIRCHAHFLIIYAAIAIISLIIIVIAGQTYFDAASTRVLQGFIKGRLLLLNVGTVVFLLIAAIGVVNLKNWARNLVVFLMYMNIFFKGFATSNSFSLTDISLKITVILGVIMGTVISAYFVLYFIKPEIKKQFISGV